MEKAGLCTAHTTDGHSFPDLFTFQLGKYGQYANHGPSEGRRGIKVFIHRHEGAAIFQKHVLDQVQGIFLRAGKPIQFPDQNGLAFFLLNKPDHALDSRPLQFCTGEARVRDYIFDNPILRYTVRPEAFLLLTDRIALFRLFAGRYPNIADHTHKG